MGGTGGEISLLIATDKESYLEGGQFTGSLFFRLRHDAEIGRDMEIAPVINPPTPLVLPVPQAQPLPGCSRVRYHDMRQLGP